MSILESKVLGAIAVVAALFVVTSAHGSDLQVLTIRPSQVDPAVTQFDAPNVVLNGGGKGAPLVVFFPGTGGSPMNRLAFLEVIARQGYKVIGLEYNDEPAANEVCPKSPDQECTAKFREMRIYGTGQSDAVSNPIDESIQTRLTRLLQALVRRQPEQGWDQFLDGDVLRWNQIIVSGLSQGAGMAAFIAKRTLTRRVVLFSSPWDEAGSHPAPWLSRQSATPTERWFAEYHRRENTANLIARAYAALGIPNDHIFIFDKDIPPKAPYGKGRNPYHGSTAANPDYAEQWRIMFGRPSDAP